MLTKPSARLKGDDVGKDSANLSQVARNRADQGRGIFGVIDGLKTRGVETNADIQWGKEFLRRIEYKL